MRDRMKTLERLASLYKAVEHTNGVTLDHARAAVHFAETKIREQEEFVEQLGEDGLAALRKGEQGQWLIDQSQMEFTQWNTEALLAWRDKREEQMMAAAEIYRASRTQLEQMECLLGEVRARLHLEHVRGEQRASDDRFLSRKRWLQRKRVLKG
jgi:hypothetical protein